VNRPGKTWLKKGALAWAAAACLGLAFLLHLEAASRVDPGRLKLESCRLFLDRQGRPLRFEPDAGGERHLYLPPEQIPPLLGQAFVAAEDKRFFRHPGLDPLAILRAARDNLSRGRIVSGASTISQQLARLAYPRRRSFYGKLIEALRALRLEAGLDKQEILALYLNRVPLGNNLVGVEAAARVYFGRSAAELSPGQAAVLASLPQAPGRLSPYRGQVERLRARQRWVLGRMAELGFLSPGQLERSLNQAIDFEARRFPLEAGHALDSLAAGERGLPAGEIRTTLDLNLQRRLEQILASHRLRLSRQGASQAAAVILGNREVEVLALAGSLDYSARDLGFNNGAQAPRSAGSTLKPFLYALALDSGFSAAEILEDVPRTYRAPGGEFVPANFDRRAYGPVSLREALGNSFNLSSVRLLDLVGSQPFYQSLNDLGLINHPERGVEHYGLGLVLGNPEVKLIQLAAAYACLANGGLFRPARLLLDRPPAQEVRVFSAQAGYIISHILADPAARAISFGGSQALRPPYRVALKTGTSTNYRDGWCLAYTPDHTLAVWAGNFDGRPTRGLSGASGAGPIAADILAELHPSSGPPAFVRPPGVSEAWVCAASGLKPSRHCPHLRRELFIRGSEPRRECALHRADGWAVHLPTPYAEWLHQRHQEGATGRFRLADFDLRLSRTFQPPVLSGREPEPGPALGPVSLGQPPQPPPPAPSGSPRAEGLSIVYPLTGDRFILGAGGTETILLRAACPEPIPRLTWFVDGLEYAAAGPPYQVAWPLSRGRHHIAAVGPNGAGDLVQIRVE